MSNYNMIVFCYLIVFSVVMLGSYLLEVQFTLTTDRNEVDMDRGYRWVQTGRSTFLEYIS